MSSPNGVSGGRQQLIHSELGSLDCVTSLGGGSCFREPPNDNSRCFMSSMRLTPMLLGLLLAYLFIMPFPSVIEAPLSPMTVTVSSLKLCLALKVCSKSFPNRNAQPPPLSKTSNSPQASTPPKLMMPLQLACDMTITLFAILNLLFNGPQVPSQCLTFSNTDVHMAATIAPPSNNPSTRTISPFGPYSCMPCLKGTSAP